MNVEVSESFIIEEGSEMYGECFSFVNDHVQTFQVSRNVSVIEDIDVSDTML